LLATLYPAFAYLWTTEPPYSRALLLGRHTTYFFADGQDVKAGDRLTVNGLILYVSGIQRFTGLGADVNHVKALCEVKNV
jgi:hypothetical protein